MSKAKLTLKSAVSLSKPDATNWTRATVPPAVGGTPDWSLRGQGRG